jgi:hypothetical protein
MAKQKGIIKLEGTLGDITFFKSGDGYIAREHAPVSASRIATDPAFERTRENNSEFSSAANAGKLVRDAVHVLLKDAKDRHTSPRLHKEMMNVLHSDDNSIRGQRKVAWGNLELLQGFEFNAAALLSNTLFAPYTATINRAAGTLAVDIPSFIPANSVTAPAGSTHFKLVSCALEVNFADGITVADIKSTDALPWNGIATAAISMAGKVTANSTQPLFLLLGIQFLQVVNGIAYPLKSSAFNSLGIIKVSSR